MGLQSCRNSHAVTPAPAYCGESQLNLLRRWRAKCGTLEQYSPCGRQWSARPTSASCDRAQSRCRSRGCGATRRGAWTTARRARAHGSWPRRQSRLFAMTAAPGEEIFTIPTDLAQTTPTARVRRPPPARLGHRTGLGCAAWPEEPQEGPHRTLRQKRPTAARENQAVSYVCRVGTVHGWIYMAVLGGVYYGRYFVNIFLLRGQMMILSGFWGGSRPQCPLPGFNPEAEYKELNTFTTDGFGEGVPPVWYGKNK